MSIEAHLKSLEDKRSQLKQQILEEMHHPASNLVLISNLKKQKLAVKEEIQRCLHLLNKQEAASSA
jgi:hypothetical protein